MCFAMLQVPTRTTSLYHDHRQNGDPNGGHNISAESVEGGHAARTSFLDDIDHDDENGSEADEIGPMLHSTPAGRGHHPRRPTASHSSREDCHLQGNAPHTGSYNSGALPARDTNLGAFTPRGDSRHPRGGGDPGEEVQALLPPQSRQQQQQQSGSTVGPYATSQHTSTSHMGMPHHPNSTSTTSATSGQDADGSPQGAPQHVTGRQGCPSHPQHTSHSNTSDAAAAAATNSQSRSQGNSHRLVGDPHSRGDTNLARPGHGGLDQHSTYTTTPQDAVHLSSSSGSSSSSKKNGSSTERRSAANSNTPQEQVLC